MKKRLKSFTLVELLVVIAIIAILSTVGIFTYNGFIKRANISSDNALVSDMNTALIQEFTMSEIKPQSAHEAYNIVKSRMSKIELKSKGFVIGWDAKSNQFLLINDKLKVQTENYDGLFLHSYIWLFVEDFDPKYEIACFNEYIYGESKNNLIQTTTGVDVGDNIIDIEYIGDREVTFRTNGGTLSIDNENAEVNHYGFADEVVIKKCKKASYHLYGQVKNIYISFGEIYVEETGKIDNPIVICKNDANNFKTLKDIIIRYMIINKNYEVVDENTVNVVEDKDLIIQTVLSYQRDENFQFIDYEDAKCQHVYGPKEVKAATCTENGYESEICTKCHYNKYTEIPCTGHSYSTNVEYVWSEDNAKCTASTVCLNCSNVDSVTVSADKTSIVADCTNDEKVTYTAIFVDPKFNKQIKETKGESAKGHMYGSPTYDFDSTTKVYKAERCCLNCTHKENEVATVENSLLSVSITQHQDTCDKDEVSLYTPHFKNAAFSNAEGKTVVTKSSKSHNYGSVTYTWSNDDSKCTAKRTCGTCNHIDSETVDSIKSIKNATCTEYAIVSYEATFKSNAFATQKKSIQSDKPLGHTLVLISHTNPKTSTTSDYGVTYDPPGKDEYECSICHNKKSESNKNYIDYWETTLNNLPKVNDSSNIFSFFYVSDIHVNTNNVSEDVTHYNYANNIGLIIKRASELTNVKNVIITGDNTASAVRTEQQMTRDLTFVQNIYKTQLAGLNVLTTRGNHDGVYGSSSYDNQIKPSIVNSYLSPIISSSSGVTLTKPNNESYYYVDYANQKVRVISLNCYYSNDSSYNFANQSQGRYGAQQLNWLASTALNVPKSDWSIIIMTHNINQFKYKLESQWEVKDQKVLFSILNAYYNALVCNENVVDQVGGFSGTVNVDFSNSSIIRGKIIGLFSGHCHMDNENETLLPFPVFSIAPATNEIKNWSSDGSHVTSEGANQSVRVKGTTNETAFDLVTIDLNTKKINLIRVGQGNRQKTTVYYKDLNTSFTVSASGNNYDKSNNATRAAKNGSYVNELSPKTGYLIEKVIVKMNGVDVTNSVVSKSGNKYKINITSVTGNISYEVTTVTSTVNVTYTGSNYSKTNTSSTTARHQSFTTTITANRNYKITGIVVKMNGSQVYSGTNGTINIADVTGNIEIAVTTEYSVVYKNVTLNNSSHVTLSGETKVLEGQTYTATVSIPNNDKYIMWNPSFTVEEDGKAKDYAYSNGKITVNGVTGDLVITASETSAAIQIGYTKGKRINSSNTIVDCTDGPNLCVSKGLKIEKGKTYYLKNMSITTTNYYYYMQFAIARTPDATKFIHAQNLQGFKNYGYTLGGDTNRVKLTINMDSSNTTVDSITIINDSEFTGDMYLFFIFVNANPTTNIPTIYVGK